MLRPNPIDSGEAPVGVRRPGTPVYPTPTARNRNPRFRPTIPKVNTECPHILYALEPDLTIAEFAAVLCTSTLAERRPVDQPDVLNAMLRNADLILTARLTGTGTLVGVSRAITDFAYCTYLSDLAVDAAHQGLGIGKELIRLTHYHAGKHTLLILLAAPAARTYYPHIGMSPHDSCWTLPRETW